MKRVRLLDVINVKKRKMVHASKNRDVHWNVFKDNCVGNNSLYRCASLILKFFFKSNWKLLIQSENRDSNFMIVSNVLAWLFWKMITNISIECPLTKWSFLHNKPNSFELNNSRFFFWKSIHLLLKMQKLRPINVLQGNWHCEWNMNMTLTNHHLCPLTSILY